MGDNAFLHQQTELFSKEYPTSAGWQVLRTSGSIIFLTPEFGEKKPGIIASSSIIYAVSHKPFFSEETDKTEFEIKKHRWNGDIRLDWHGSPIILRSFYYEEDHGCAKPQFLIAVKDWAVFEDFFRALLEFSREKDKLRAVGRIQSYTDEIRCENISWNDIVLPIGMAADIQASSESFFSSKERYDKFKLPYKRGFIFCGPAGCGKTLASKIIISTLKLPAYSLTHMGETHMTLRAIEEAFEWALQNAPSVIAIEELEKMADRQYISLILNLMDGLRPLRGVLVIACTNYPEQVDPTLLLRPSRFDRVWAFPLPDQEARFKLLKKKGGEHFSETTLMEAAKRSEGFSMAYVQEIFATTLSLSAQKKTEITDALLLESVEVLRHQIKNAQKPLREIGQGDPAIGFSTGLEAELGRIEAVGAQNAKP